ncbi:MAG: hypothetical protein KJ070_02270, partial [Verrucomicrobia bacterium]|nr:hypothetical protein [Verrucomicrobiota bacterium]
MTSPGDNLDAAALGGGKQGATPLSSAQVPTGSAVAPLRSGTEVQSGVSLSRTAWIAAGFCLVVVMVMLYQHFRAAERDPWKSPQLLALKEQLRESPADESLRSEIRRLDLEFRQRYFRRLAL